MFSSFAVRSIFFHRVGDCEGALPTRVHHAAKARATRASKHKHTCSDRFIPFISLARTPQALGSLHRSDQVTTLPLAAARWCLKRREFSQWSLNHGAPL